MTQDAFCTRQGFRLVDRNNNLRAELSLSDEDQPILIFYDSGGESRMTIGLSTLENPGLTLKDKNGVRVSLLASQHTHLILYGKNSEKILELVIQPDGTPRVRVDGEDIS